MLFRKLPSEINDPAIEERIRAAFEASPEWRIRPAMANYLPVFEHGHWWMQETISGAIWSVVDGIGGRAIDGFVFELVSEGEEDPDPPDVDEIDIARARAAGLDPEDM